MRLKIAVSPIPADLELANERFNAAFGFGSVVCVGTEHIYVDVPGTDFEAAKIRMQDAGLGNYPISVCGKYNIFRIKIQ